MKMQMDLRTSLTQTLTPQQIQYLKLLQLPVVQLEQHVREEIEHNPMLEEAGFEDNYSDSSDAYEPDENYTPPAHNESYEDEYQSGYETVDVPKESIDDIGDPFQFYKMAWQDDSDYTHHSKHNEEDDGESFQMKDNTTLAEDMLQQLFLQNLSKEEYLLGEQIIGNVDNDGYLRRDLLEILSETNELIDDLNYEFQTKNEDSARAIIENGEFINPARQFAVSSDALALLKQKQNGDITSDEENSDLSSNNKELKHLTIVHAERIVSLIHTFDPPGYASRTVKECLIAQLHAIAKPKAAQKLALEILDKTYDAFAMKHYHVILKQLEVTEDYLREALDVIRHLNPKPGGSDAQSSLNTVIPDFIITRDEETRDLLITVNDSRIPALHVNKAYEKLKKEAKVKVFNKETREWIRNKYEDAKFLIQAIRQRKSTMLKVMTAIAGLQKDFFEIGPAGLKPLIYKIVSEDTGLDISTVCRIVNGKYVQTEYGTFELKFFFSESLPSEDGEDVSTTVIKQILKEIIDSEPKGKPFSDERIAKELKKRGNNVARRTIAKYREQLKIPVARLRKEL